MSQPINYELAKDALHKLNTDDTISSAHGLLCGFYCVKQNIELDDWLNEILVSIDLNNLLEKEAHQVLAEIFNNTNEQLAGQLLPTIFLHSESRQIPSSNGVKDS